jgi:hypothetical protein
MKTESNEKEKKSRSVKKVRKGSRIDLMFGYLEGKIFFDDTIFNLGVRPS